MTSGPTTPTSSSGNNSRPALIKIKHLSMVRLDRSNYFTWKARTLAHLRGYELLLFIEKPITTADLSLIQQDQPTFGMVVLGHLSVNASLGHDKQNIIRGLDGLGRDF